MVWIILLELLNIFSSFLSEQTAEEVERTQQFAEEVVELMKHTTNCSMAFNKFIPSYHHHFGKQCRVADFGFTKLIELFEVIPNVLEVTCSLIYMCCKLTDITFCITSCKYLELLSYKKGCGIILEFFCGLHKILYKLCT